MKFGVLKCLLVGTALLVPALSLALAPKAGAASAASSSCIDLALVLAVDSSASVSPGEFALQRHGLAEAFRDPAVLAAISSAGRVAVSILFWASETMPKQQSAWVLIDSREGAEEFSRMIEATPREITGDTGLGAGIATSLAKFGSLEGCAIRKIINVSGDGKETLFVRGKRRFPAPEQAKELAEEMDVEINALAISNEEPDLAGYYSRKVVTGPDAFVMEVRNYADFSQAIRRKLIREISPRIVSGLHPGEAAPAAPLTVPPG